jgi:LrgB-like family
MTDNIVNDSTHDSSSKSPQDVPLTTGEVPKNSFRNFLSQHVPSGNDLFSSDGHKEIGFLAILAWHHSIAKLATRQKISVPPVLLSTISMLVGLCVVKKVSGRETTDQIVKFFDPSVDFLGTWMSLWLVPSLVLLPNALRKIEKADHVMWVKLIITHFILWYASTLGTAKLYELIERKSNGITNPVELNRNDLTLDINVESVIDSNSSEISQDSAHAEISKDEVEAKNGTALIEETVSNTLLPTVNTDPAPPTIEEANAEKARKQLKLLRFWGAITAFFYAVPCSGLISSKIPALGIFLTLCLKSVKLQDSFLFILMTVSLCTSGGTTITALVAGQMMPVDVKKVFHPLLLATAVSAIAAVLSDRFMCTGSRHLEEAFGKRGRSWIDSLLCYTTPTASALANGTVAMKTGDYFALVLGPACTALAFRIFSQSEKLQSKLPAILAASAVSAVTSLLVSPLLGAAVGIPAELNAALAHVSVLIRGVPAF